MARRMGWFLALALLVPGCVRVPLPTSQPSQQQPGKGPERTIRLHVLEGGDGAVLALIPVTIKGKGPSLFALDTGASSSVVSADLAKKLSLPTQGKGRQVSGVFAGGEVDLATVSQWGAGDVKFPKTTVAILNIHGQSGSGPSLEGLLGSDVLSDYGVITIDYDRQLLVLRSRTVPRRRGG